MAIGNGYGSECHLLRYLGRHRQRLNRAVGGATGATDIEWLDFPFSTEPGIVNLAGRSAPWPDAEWKALEFLPDAHPARIAWQDFWPTSGNTLNWDAVGIGAFDGNNEWLLVEAKAHLAELRSACSATENGGRPRIRAAFETTRRELGVSGGDWLADYYQYCNRVAALAFLQRFKVPAHLVMVYFTGDRRPDSCVCPASEQEWRPALELQAAWVGVPEVHPLKAKIHEVFLPIHCFV